MSVLYGVRRSVKGVLFSHGPEEDATSTPLRDGDLGGGRGGGGVDSGACPLGRCVQSGFLTSSWAMVVVAGVKRRIQSSGNLQGEIRLGVELGRRVTVVRVEILK